MSIKEKKLGGRPKLASYQKRTKCFRVMFTENDYIYIQSKAEQAGLSVNEFCHQAAMDCQVCQRISPEMVSAIRDLSGIANNVNQIAHQMAKFIDRQSSLFRFGLDINVVVLGKHYPKTFRAFLITRQLWATTKFLFLHTYLNFDVHILIF